MIYSVISATWSKQMRAASQRPMCKTFTKLAIAAANMALVGRSPYTATGQHVNSDEHSTHCQAHWIVITGRGHLQMVL